MAVAHCREKGYWIEGCVSRTSVYLFSIGERKPSLHVVHTGEGLYRYIWEISIAW